MKFMENVAKDAGSKPGEASQDVNSLFDIFVKGETCSKTITSFTYLCQLVGLQYPPSWNDHTSFYPRLKEKLSSSWRAKSLWAKLDKRWYGKEFFVKSSSYKSDGRRAGENMKALIIGAGPCGLRTAIDLACLGVKTVVLEKRDAFSRNNILHLWPFIISDLKALGAKKFYGRFCAGAIDHISIRQLQLILLKIALILGVDIVLNVAFEDVIPPGSKLANDNKSEGWTALVNPHNHSVSNYSFDVLVGADGKRNTLKGFTRKEFRGKLAIGLTVNFINHHTSAEAKVEEISGVAYIFNQDFFKELHRVMGIDLENIVYYKGDTHYFVMTTKKQSLLSKKVLRKDCDEIENLLSVSNVDEEMLAKYAKEAADFSTLHQLPNLEFAINQYGEPDIGLFDFTCMYAAENAALFRDVDGCKLLTCLVGDSLLEPFWPMGTGCARGFLAAFDTVWMTKQWASCNSIASKSNSAELEILAERESVYRILHQTTPQTTAKNFSDYTIDPSSRYINLNRKAVNVNQVACLYIKDGDFSEANITHFLNSEQNIKVTTVPEHTSSGSPLTRKASIMKSNKLISWCQRVTKHYDGVNVINMTTSWKNGLALCAIIHHFRPDLISWENLDATNVQGNNQLAFDIAEKRLGILPVLTGKDMEAEIVDKLVMVTYVSQFYEVFKHESPVFDNVKDQGVMKERNKHPVTPNSTSPVGLLTRFTQHIKRQSLQVKPEDYSKKKKFGVFKKKGHANQEPPCTQLKSVEKENVSMHKTAASREPHVLKRVSEQPPLNLKNSGDQEAGVHQRASSRISALSNQLISHFEQNAPESTPKSSRRQVATKVKEKASDLCYFCNHCVFIVERMSAEGLFFHRQCFICSHCGITLRHGNYEFSSRTGKFFCRAHFFAHSDAFSQDPRQKDSIDAVDSAGTSPNKKMVITRYKNLTPERIELENRHHSIKNNLEELSEEALTVHNLTQYENSIMDNESLSDSSDEEDVDWETEFHKSVDVRDMFEEEMKDNTDKTSFECKSNESISSESTESLDVEENNSSEAALQSSETLITGCKSIQSSNLLQSVSEDFNLQTNESTCKDDDRNTQAVCGLEKNMSHYETPPLFSSETTKQVNNTSKAALSADDGVLHTTIRILPRQSSVDSILLRSSSRRQNDTSIWSDVEDNKACSNKITGNVHSHKDSGLPPLERKLSFNSMQQRMKERLVKRNEWIKASPSLNQEYTDNCKPNQFFERKLISPSTPDAEKFTDSSDNDEFHTPLACTPKDTRRDFKTQSTVDNVDNINRILPTLPKVPHLEALSPTALATTPSITTCIEKDFKLREQRVQKKISRMKEQSKLNKNKVKSPTTSGTSSSMKSHDISYGSSNLVSQEESQLMSLQKFLQKKNSETGQKDILQSLTVRSSVEGLTPSDIDAKISRRIQIAAKRHAKLEAQKRLRRAQVIQRQLEEVEVKQRGIEERGVKLEQLLRSGGHEAQGEGSTQMEEWFKLVQEKNNLLRYENELMIFQRELQLEDAQSQLQQQLREKMTMDDTHKTSSQLAEEKAILQKMLEVVEQRDELVRLLEKLRLKESHENDDLETSLLIKRTEFAD
ncbi:protein-methionine sulfoxide oxidase mical3b-like isoform X1 [Clavelina lepadiformis]|uniref:protein-methionine sulfoxide oxidase mical3b-like isoform X1 n=1 Tax=Clavelina lepadiformis TaxID=159417 RepID=UPI004041CD12